MFRTTALALLTLALTGFAQPNDPTLVSVPLTKAYIPVGFDSNDLPEIMVTGQFADLCYQLEKQDVRVDQARQRITIFQRAYRYTGNHCWGLKVPFEQVTNLPLLEPGDYEIVDGYSKSVLGKIQINRATHTGPGTGTDDFPYAPVSDLTLSLKKPFEYNVVVAGVLPNNCLRIHDVQVKVYSDVVVILPILEFSAPASGLCTAGYYPYRQQAPIGQLLGQHTYLFHARSMNGQAVNRLMDPFKKFPVDPTSPTY